jgi:hypothetical protein
MRDPDRGHAHWDNSLKLGAKVRRRIKHRDISYVRVIWSLAELQVLNLGLIDPSSVPFFYVLCLVKNESSKMRAPPEPPLCSAPSHAIIFMQITRLVFMAATFYHNQLKEASEENIFLCYYGWTPARVGGWEPLFSRSENNVRSIPSIFIIPST